jgi:hypothetical protein
MRTTVFALVLAACGSNGAHAPDGALPDGATPPDGALPAGDLAQTTTTSCLGSDFLKALGRDHLLAGASMADSSAAAAPFDLRYVYLSGAFPDGTGPCASCATGCATGGKSCANSAGGCGWWGCWQYDQDPPGGYARDFVGKGAAATPPQIPMFTYYLLLQASGLQEGASEVAAANDAAFMARYFDDWRFLLQQIGSSTAFLHIEPDFWGYAEMVNADPRQTPAQITTANPTDCGGQENSIAGLGRCLIAMVRKYAPNAKVGLHGSAWGTSMDVLANTDASFDVVGEAQKLGAFLIAAGAAGGDFLAVDASDRDAGFYQAMGRNTWWDKTNATLPDFHQAFAWAGALAEAVGKPILWWQLPVGNEALDDTCNHYRDNRVDYLFAHPQEVARAHGVGLAFGAGAGCQTTPESDNGNLIAKVNAYAAVGGQPLCIK